MWSVLGQVLSNFSCVAPQSPQETCSKRAELIHGSGSTAAAFRSGFSSAARAQQGWLMGIEGPGEEKMLLSFTTKHELKAEWG